MRAQAGPRDGWTERDFEEASLNYELAIANLKSRLVAAEAEAVILVEAIRWLNNVL